MRLSFEPVSEFSSVRCHNLIKYHLSNIKITQITSQSPIHVIILTISLDEYFTMNFVTINFTAKYYLHNIGYNWIKLDGGVHIVLATIISNVLLANTFENCDKYFLKLSNIANYLLDRNGLRCLCSVTSLGGQYWRLSDRRSAIRLRPAPVLLFPFIPRRSICPEYHLYLSILQYVFLQISKHIWDIFAATHRICMISMNSLQLSTSYLHLA